jgi:phosphate/sulfate permease
VTGKTYPVIGTCGPAQGDTDQTPMTTTTCAVSFEVGLSTTGEETTVTVSADLLELDEAEALIGALRAAVITARASEWPCPADSLPETGTTGESTTA